MKKPISLEITPEQAGLSGNTVIHDEDPLASDSGETEKSAAVDLLERAAARIWQSGKDNALAREIDSYLDSLKR